MLIGFVFVGGCYWAFSEIASSDLVVSYSGAVTICLSGDFVLMGVSAERYALNQTLKQYLNLRRMISKKVYDKILDAFPKHANSPEYFWKPN